jgi:glyoxylase-like metal-dependent hydrolase (beta-lactamase superfamily II)
VLKRVSIGVAAVHVLAVLVVAGILVQAHRAIRRERAPLPAAEDLAQFLSAPASDLPVRLSWINTASQRMPRSAVLEPNEDARTRKPYVMSHPAFVLEWGDGRLLLIDAGMRRHAAVEFGRPLERLAGARPIVPHESIADALGDAVASIRGIVFTHLHTDHVDGVLSLCAGDPAPQITAFMTEAQATRPNYTTGPGLALLEQASCVRREVLGDERLRLLPGFPGVAVIDAGGHTPGSEIVLARVEADDGERLYAFAGDTVNHLDGIVQDIPKPFLYRTFVVPESEERQRELRRYLAALARDRGARLIVSHDEASLAGELLSWHMR